MTTRAYPMHYGSRHTGPLYEARLEAKQLRVENEKLRAVAKLAGAAHETWDASDGMDPRYPDAGHLHVEAMHALGEALAALPGGDK